MNVAADGSHTIKRYAEAYSEKVYTQPTSYSEKKRIIGRKKHRQKEHWRLIGDSISKFIIKGRTSYYLKADMKIDKINRVALITLIGNQTKQDASNFTFEIVE